MIYFILQTTWCFYFEYLYSKIETKYNHIKQWCNKVKIMSHPIRLIYFHWFMPLCCILHPSAYNFFIGLIWSKDIFRKSQEVWATRFKRKGVLCTTFHLGCVKYPPSRVDRINITLYIKKKEISSIPPHTPSSTIE